jgi:two-component system response regulator YesN
MNILVVDDEKVIREGITRTIKQQFPNLHTRAAASAQEALTIMRDEVIHLVFLDIRMPEMTGLELMSLTHKLKLNLKWIVISAYSEFSYAQEAIRLGASDYILKPVGKGKLIELITSHLAAFDEQIRQSDEVKLFQFNQKYLREAVIQRWVHGLDIGRFDLTSIAEQHPNYYLLLVRVESKLDLEIKHFIMENVLAELIELNGHGFVVSIDHQSILGIFTLADKASIHTLEEESKNHLKNCLKVPFQLQVSGHLTNFEAIPSEVGKLRNHSAKDSVDLEMKKNEDVITIALQYIHAHYFLNVSLEKVAAIIYLNPIYFSQLFKQRMGIGYKDYVIQLRMERAKELLCDSSLRITDVAELVGYPDIRYFTQVFRKRYHVTPTEYRNK